MSRRTFHGQDLGGVNVEVTPDEMMDQLREVSGSPDSARVVVAFPDGSWVSAEWPASYKVRLGAKGARDGR